jgi:DNA repair exonuclease SbcCD nuclease subunit
VEIGNMKPEEALPLADTFDYVALGHGHKPYVIQTAADRTYAYNPGSPERVNFGEERYDKGYYLVTFEDGRFQHEFRTTSPRPMLVTTINLEGTATADEALDNFQRKITEKLVSLNIDKRRPLLEVKLVGRVGFHPFELGREKLRLLLDEVCNPLHLEIRNQLSLIRPCREGEGAKQSLNEIERDVLGELINASSVFKERKDELVTLALAIRDLVIKGDCEGEELLGLLSREP